MRLRYSLQMSTEEVQPIVEFFVEGDPKGQPRPRVAVIAGRARVYSGKSAGVWAKSVRDEAERYFRRNSSSPIKTYPVEVRFDFLMPRPKSHYGTGKNAKTFKHWAPQWHTNKPDLDNCVKLVIDQMHGYFFDDDKCGCCIRSTKRYADDKPGCWVRLYLA